MIPKHKFKTVTIGNSSVGKSSIIMQFVQGVFNLHRESTIGASFLTNRIETRDKQGNDIVVGFEIWDTAGQERYKCLIPMYLRGAQAIIFVFDLTDIKSFDDMVESWMPDVFEQTDSDKCVYYVFGNKNDLYETGRYPNIDTMVENRLKKFKNVKYFKTSAKTGKNIHEVFLDAASELMEKCDLNGEESKNITLGKVNEDNGSCCF